MKIEIDTSTDSYELWKKIQELVEDAYREPIQKLEVGPGGPISASILRAYHPKEE